MKCQLLKTTWPNELLSFYTRLEKSFPQENFKSELIDWNGLTLISSKDQFRVLGSEKKNEINPYYICLKTNILSFKKYFEGKVFQMVGKVTYFIVANQGKQSYTYADFIVAV